MKVLRPHDHFQFVLPVHNIRNEYEFDKKTGGETRLHDLAYCTYLRFSVNLTLHTNTIELRFQFFSLWRPFSKVFIFSVLQLRRIRNVREIKTKQKFVFSKEEASMCTGP